MPGRSLSSANGYRYGFNGQEKDDEIEGSGNSYTAEFWQYDSRLGRRWNIDPVDQISISNYATFADNPILMSDPNGATPGEGDDKKSPPLTSQPPKDPKEGDVWNYQSGDHSSQQVFKNGKWELSGQMSGNLPEVEVGTTSKETDARIAREIYDRQMSERHTVGGKMHLWADHLSASWEKSPPWFAKTVANINPLVSGYNVGNGIFGNGNDIYGDKQSKLGIGLNALGTFAPFASEFTTANGFLGGSVSYELKADLDVTFRASENAMKYGTFQYSTLAPSALMRTNWFPRTMLQITSEFQPTLGAMQRAVIPMGTKIQVGFVGYQSGMLPGTWLQIYTKQPIRFQ